jgi:aminoglycoside phosphotransferase (APT) family kinase protein
MAERIAAARLDSAVRDAALDILARAPGGDSVLHGDFHPGNVFVTMDGPVVIDWIDTARGHPSADIARTEWLLTGGETPGEGLNRRVIDRLRKGFVKQYLARVTRGMAVNRKVVDAWRIPTLAARLAEGVESEEPQIIEELERLIG